MEKVKSMFEEADFKGEGYLDAVGMLKFVNLSNEHMT